MQIELLPPVRQGAHANGAHAGVWPTLERFLTLDDVKLITTLSKSSIYQGINAGTFPAPIPIARGRVAWLATDVAVWQRHVRSNMPQRRRDACCAA
jgi:prophage regulatory protein